MRLSQRIFAILAALGLAVVPLAIGAQGTSQSVARIQIVDPNGLPVRDAVVEVRPAGKFAGTIRFPWHMAMAQKNQQFTPGTLIVAKGSVVAFPNLDRVRHSIYSFSKPAKFEIDLYGRDQTRTQSFPITGTVALGCTIHDAMRGYIRIVDTPYAAKTDANGYVTIVDTPTGKADVVVWHPQLRAPGNEITQTIAIRGGSQAQRYRVAMR